MRSKKARLAYGPESLQAEDDISSELDVQKVKYYEEEIKVDQSQIARIEHGTTQQSLSEKWVTERKKKTHRLKFRQSDETQNQNTCCPSGR